VLNKNSQFSGNCLARFTADTKALMPFVFFFIGNPDGLLIGYLKEAVIPETAMIYWRQKYKGKTVLLWGQPPRSAEKETGL